MKYKKVEEAVFLSRPNRFIARVLREGREETVHVKNTGRCRELLVPGARVYLAHSEKAERKTAWDLVAVEKEREGKAPLLINMDSFAPNDAAWEWLRAGNLFPEGTLLRREVTFQGSRFDFFASRGEKEAYLEVKGVTLEKDGRVFFPDAPTLRGVKHLEELIQAKKKGHRALILFVIQMEGAISFSPNEDTHPAFGEALRRAKEAGVEILAMDCKVSPDEISLFAPVPVVLERKK